MFCPNCGAQNQDTATACAKCGFALKAAASAPKFKGTMLMMNAPTAAKPAAAPAAPPAGSAPPNAGPSAPPASATAPAVAPQVSPKPKLKGTMIGVAPPSMGSNTGPGGGAPAPAPAPQDFGTPPPGFGAPPAGFGAPPPGFGAPPPAFDPPPAFGSPPAGYGAPPAYEPPPPAAPPAHGPSSAVNPLGGTVVADAGAFGGGFPPAPSPQQGYDIGGAPPGFGGPPPGFGGAQDGGYGATSPMGGGMGTSPMPQSGAMQPMGGDSLAPIPGTVGGSNPIVTVLLIVLTFGLYGIYLLVKGKKSPT